MKSCFTMLLISCVRLDYSQDKFTAVKSDKMLTFFADHSSRRGISIHFCPKWSKVTSWCRKVTWCKMEREWQLGSGWWCQTKERTGLWNESFYCLSNWKFEGLGDHFNEIVTIIMAGYNDVVYHLIRDTLPRRWLIHCLCGFKTLGLVNLNWGWGRSIYWGNLKTYEIVYVTWFYQEVMQQQVGPSQQSYASMSPEQRRASARMSGGVDYEEEWHKIADQLEEVRYKLFFKLADNSLSSVYT